MQTTCAGDLHLRCPAAIRTCAQASGRRPTVLGYAAWHRATLQTAHLAGQPRPRLHAIESITRHCGGWSRACALALIGEHPLCAPDVAKAAERAHSITDRLTDAELASARLDASQIAIVRSHGARGLVLADAITLARGLGACLDHLAGRTRTPGRAPEWAHARLDLGLVLRHTRARGITDAALRQALGIGLGPWRRLGAGSLDPTLGQLIEIAGLFECAATGLLVPTPDTPGDE